MMSAAIWNVPVRRHRCYPVRLGRWTIGTLYLSPLYLAHG